MMNSQPLSNNAAYAAFLNTKSDHNASVGLSIDRSSVDHQLYPFQAAVVQWAIKKGRCAIFADCGLGKTFIQLEWARLIGQRTLIVAPLAVAQQTVLEGRKLNADIPYVRSDHESHGLIVVTNYEMLDRFRPEMFGAVVLDESSILKSVDGRTRQKLNQMFARTPYRLACTATPAPNDIAELANHAAFLGIMTREEMLAAYFVHDDSGWRLKGHAQNAFYKWLASWSLMFTLPSNLGFTNNGYILPELRRRIVTVPCNTTEVARATGKLFIDGLDGIQGRIAARRETVSQKAEVAAHILNGSDEQWVVWCGLNAEAAALSQRVSASCNVSGSDTLEAKVDGLMGFMEGRHRILITKPRIAGFGLNLQHCHNMMFIGLTDSYETYYQAIRRCWRFGQTEPVNVVVVISEVEVPILENVERKAKTHASLVNNLASHLEGYERVELGMDMAKKSIYTEDTQTGENWRMLLGDAVERLASLDSASIDFTIFSPPFLSLYTYSDSVRDLGNSKDDEEFIEHFAFICRELHRVMKPGRNVAIHVSQVPAKLVNDGYIGLKDFRGLVITAATGAGFHYHGDITVDKNPQVQAIRTHAKGLLFAQLKKDSSWLRPGLADYILVFRTPGDNLIPIHPDISNALWIEWAHPVWYGIQETNTLNTEIAKTDRDERHIAPLQLGVIERCIRLWSNPGEVVLSPFAGIGSEGYQSILLGRRFIGIELKREYYDVACRNLKHSSQEKHQLTLQLDS